MGYASIDPDKANAEDEAVADRLERELHRTTQPA
jgi:hypothetical protein